MPKIERAEKRTTEATIQDKIRAALGKMPDVTMYRNQVGRYYCVDPGKAKARGLDGFWVTTGLGPGTSDLVGLVTVPIDALYRAGVQKVGIFSALEVKKADAHGEHGEHETEQREWLEFVRGRGGAAPEFCTSASSAIEAVTRIRGGRLRA